MIYTFNPIAPGKVDRYAPVDYEELKYSSDSFCMPFIIDADKSGPTPSSLHSPQLCDRLVHPEGSIFYYFQNIISTQPIIDTHISLAEEIFRDCETWITRADTTIFLDLKSDQANYYVVVHQSKSITWACGKSPESFQRATGPQLEMEYWLHVENFPGPRFTAPQDLQTLKNVLSSYAIDAATSDGSTSPMSARQIEGHIRQLDSFSTEPEIHQTYAIARLWNMVLQSRQINNYGTEDARLDRFLALGDHPPTFRGPYALIAKLSFGTAGAHLHRCSRAWADRIAYTEEWNQFKTKNQRDWEMTINLSCFLALACLLQDTQLTRVSSVVASRIALSMALASSASSYYLSNESQNLGNYAADASNYFQQREEALHGVQRIAIINALPQILLYWGFLVFLLLALVRLGI